MAANQRLTFSEKRRRKRACDERRRAGLINIGCAIKKWKILRDCLALDNEELAAALIDYYEEHCPKPTFELTSTPLLQHGLNQRLPLVGLSESGSESESEMCEKGFNGCSQTIEVSTEVNDVTGSKNSPYDSPDQYADAEEMSDDDDEDTYIDPEDITWEPSLNSIKLSDDSNLDETQEENYPDDVVMDANFDVYDGLESDEEESSGNLTRGGCLRQDNPEEAAASEKSICYTSCLQQLAHMEVPQSCCTKGCDAEVSMHTSKKGTALVITWKCSKFHIVRSWCSQPKLPRGVLAGDFALAATILLSGNNYRKVALMLKFLRLGCVNANSFYRIQSLYCCPAIDMFWEKTLNTTIRSLQEQEVVVAGDGRMDSPGFCAKFCTYTVLNIPSMDIVSMQVIDKRQTNLKSPSMETKGLKDSMEEMRRKGLKIKEFVTDAHPSISAHMRKNEENVKHSYDIWHGAKNLSKKLTAIASYKATRDLLPWRKDIVNHFWNCSKTANGDELLLRNKWTGVVHHTVDEHEWALGSYEHAENLDQEKEYLTPGSPSHRALIDLVFDDKLLRNLKYYVNFRSTAELEGFQNHILMYAGKRFAYSYPVYKARCELAALDYQMHKERPAQLTKDGKIMWHRMYNKNSVRWNAVPLKEQKEYLYIQELLADIFKRRIEDSGSISRRVEVLETDPRRLSQTVAPIPPPPTCELVAARISRFQT